MINTFLLAIITAENATFIDAVLDWRGFALILLGGALITAITAIWGKLIKPVLRMIENTNRKSEQISATLNGYPEIKDPITGEILQEAVEPLGVRIWKTENSLKELKTSVEEVLTNQEDTKKIRAELCEIKTKIGERL